MINNDKSFGESDAVEGCKEECLEGLSDLLKSLNTHVAVYVAQMLPSVYY